MEYVTIDCNNIFIVIILNINIVLFEQYLLFKKLLGGNILKYEISSKDALRLSIFVIAVLSVFCMFTDNSTAATINVGSGAGNQSATIQGGITAASANDKVIST